MEDRMCRTCQCALSLMAYCRPLSPPSTEHRNGNTANPLTLCWWFRPAPVQANIPLVRPDRFLIHTLRSIPHTTRIYMQKYETSHTTRMEHQLRHHCNKHKPNSCTPVRLRVLWFYELCDICSRFFSVFSFPLLSPEWTAAAAVVPSFIYLVPVGCYFYRCLHWLMAVAGKLFALAKHSVRPETLLFLVLLLLLLSLLLFAQNNNYVGGNWRTCTLEWVKLLLSRTDRANQN